MSIRLCLLCLLFALPALPAAAAPLPAVDFQVTGAVTKPMSYSPSALRGQFKDSLQTIIYTRRGVKHTARALPLWTVLQAAGPRVNPQIKNHTLQFVALVSRQDGYTAAFSFGELSPSFGNKKAWLALDEDGHSLGETADAETDLIVPDDVKAGRWVHSVTRVLVVDEAGSR